MQITYKWIASTRSERGTHSYLLWLLRSSGYNLNNNSQAIIVFHGYYSSTVTFPKALCTPQMGQYPCKCFIQSTNEPTCLQWVRATANPNIPSQQLIRLYQGPKDTHRSSFNNTIQSLTKHQRSSPVANQPFLSLSTVSVWHPGNKMACEHIKHIIPEVKWYLCMNIFYFLYIINIYK